SLSKSTQLDYAIPASKISTLSSGEFVGIVADDPDTEIDLKVFHNKIQNDHEKLKKEEMNFKAIPKIRTIDSEIVEMTYFQIKQDIQEIIVAELGMNNRNETAPGSNSDHPSNSKMRNMRM